MIGRVIGGLVYLYRTQQITQDPKDGIEKYLKPAMGRAILLPIAIFIFAWGSTSFSHWFAPCFAAAIFCLGAVCIFQSIFNYLGRGFYR